MNLAGLMHSPALLEPGRDLAPLTERLLRWALSRHLHRWPVSGSIRRAAAQCDDSFVSLSC
jgi:hypothetical protein